MNNVIWLVFLFQTTLGILDTILIQKYLAEKTLKSAIIFGCFNKKEKVTLTKEFAPNSQVLLLNIQSDVKKNPLKTDCRIGIILDGDCENVENFLLTYGELNIFNHKHHWLVISTTNSVLDIFEKVNFNINSNVHLAIQNNTNKSWSIMEIYNPAAKHGGTLKVIERKDFNENSQSVYWERRNMSGVTFKTIVVFLAPFKGTFENYLLSDEDRNVNTFNRFQHKLLCFCKDYYNFTLITELGKSWGYPLPNGSFDGMVGAMEHKLIHFGSSPIFVRVDRNKVIDYGRNTWSWKAGFLFRSPKTRPSFKNFFRPLSGAIWLITCLFGVLSVIILKLVTTFESKRNHENVETSWSLSIIFTLGAFCQQGASAVPKMACGRITAFSILILSLIVYQFYSASIVSSLLMKPTNKIENLQDLIASSLKVACEDIIYNTELFAHTTDPTLKELYYKKIYEKGNKSHFFPTDKGLRLIKDGGYAFHTEVARAYPIIEKEFSDKAICELREVKLFKNTDLYTTYQKNTPFFDMLETCFQKLAERGILFREKRHWHPRKPECGQSTRALISFHVGIDEFYPALLILLIGIGLSLIVFLIEIQVKLYRNKKRFFPFIN